LVLNNLTTSDQRAQVTRISVAPASLPATTKGIAGEDVGAIGVPLFHSDGEILFG